MNLYRSNFVARLTCVLAGGQVHLGTGVECIRTDSRAAYIPSNTAMHHIYKQLILQ